MNSVPATDVPRLSLLRPGPGTELTLGAADDTGRPITLDAADGAVSLRLEVELGAAVGYWHPNQGSMRSLPADWAGRTVTSLVTSAPLGVLYDAAGAALFGWAADRPVDELTIAYGVSEEHKSFAVEITAAPGSAGPLQLVLDSADGTLAQAVRRLAGWMSARLADPPLPAPPAASEPVYSTWYTFTQDVSAELVEAEAARAVRLGCGTVFIDDGWQRLAVGRGYQGCGDWLPDPATFPDLRAHVRRLHDLGAGVVLWVAPLLLGTRSDAYAELAGYATLRRAPDDCFVLDPRHRAVREHLADLCLRLVTDYGLDGLKIDFLDTAMRYQGTPSTGDLADIGAAMAELLRLLRSRLDAAGHGEVMFEFRQPYVSPAIARAGQILRAGDCPGDAAVNLRSTVDCRLLSTGQVVHSDPMMWGPTGGVTAVAQQLYAGMFAVPQLSMRLAELKDDQADALAALLGWWRELAPTLLHGELQVTGAERGYTSVRSVDRARGRAVIGLYAPIVVDLDADLPAEVTVVNASAADAIVLRSQGRSVTGGEIRTAGRERVGAITGAGPGLVELAVPAFGSAVLTLG